MTDASESTGASRRQLLRSGVLVSGAALFGGAAAANAGGLLGEDDESTGTDTDPGESEDDGEDDDEHERDELVDAIAAHGHYAWFPVGPDTWARSTEPVDTSSDDLRWLSQPASDGGVRCRVENLPAGRNAGFDLHLGTLDEVVEVAVESRTVQTQHGTGPATLGVGLYLDRDGNDDFFEWESGDGPIDAWSGFGDDEEGFRLAGANGTYVIDDETTFGMIQAETEATLGELKSGAVEGVDGSTDVGLYLGVASSGDGVEEAVVEDVAVSRH